MSIVIEKQREVTYTSILQLSSRTKESYKKDLRKILRSFEI